MAKTPRLSLPPPRVTVVRLGSPPSRARRAVAVVRRAGGAVARRTGRSLKSIAKPAIGGAIGGGVYALAAGLIPEGWHPVVRLGIVSAVAAIGSDMLGLPSSVVSGIAGAAGAETVRQLRGRNRAADQPRKP